VATKSISSGAQYVTLGKYFSHPSLVLYCFATPRIKLKLGQQIGGGPITGNHLDKSLWWTNQKHWAAVRSYYHSLFFGCIASLCPLPVSATWAILESQNHFRGPNPTHKRGFSSSYFTLQDHIPSTAGDALSR
jgi:hypothetical protein